MLPMIILAIEDDSDRAFITDVYLQYRTMMLRAIRKAGHGYHDAEDVMNEALIRLIRNLETLRRLNKQNAECVCSAAEIRRYSGRTVEMIRRLLNVKRTIACTMLAVVLVFVLT